MSSLVRFGPYRSMYIDIADDTTIKTGAGIFYGIVLGERPVVDPIIITDGNNTIATIKSGSPEGMYTYNVLFSNDLSVQTNSDCKLTVLYE